MSDLRFILLSVAVMFALFAAVVVWSSNTAAEVCRRAGVALGKKPDYSLRYGCFLDGVPSEMIREIP